MGRVSQADRTDPGATLTRVWSIKHPTLTGTEFVELEEHSTGNLLRGWVVALVDGMGCAVEYVVAVDSKWVTRRVDVTLHRGHIHPLVIEHDGEGGWTVDGVSRSDLDGCLDVDLGVSPSTNTLPIRRLNLEVAAEATLNAAWVRFPELVVEVLPQSYQRKAESVYRYRSDSFEADLEVDDQGVVLQYGDSLWQTLG